MTIKRETKAVLKRAAFVVIKNCIFAKNKFSEGF